MEDTGNKDKNKMIDIIKYLLISLLMYFLCGVVWGLIFFVLFIIFYVIPQILIAVPFLILIGFIIIKISDYFTGNNTVKSLIEESDPFGGY